MGQTLSNTVCETSCQDINSFLTKIRPSYFNKKWKIDQYHINSKLSEKCNYQLNKNDIVIKGPVKPGYITISKELSVSFNKLNTLEIPLNIKINNADSVMILVVITGMHYNINDVIHDMSSKKKSDNIYFTTLFNSSNNKNSVSYSLLSDPSNCEHLEWINNKCNNYIISIKNNIIEFEIKQEFSNEIMKKTVTNNLDKISLNLIKDSNIMVHVIPFYPKGLSEDDDVSIRII